MPFEAKEFSCLRNIKSSNVNTPGLLNNNKPRYRFHILRYETCIGAYVFLLTYSFSLALRNELVTTLTLLKAMAAPAIMGLSMKPQRG